MNELNCLSTFAQVVDTRSFTKAAELLGLPRSIVTKQIQWLEHHLNTQLLVRTTRSIALTESGQSLYKNSQQWLAEWDEIKAGIAGEHVDVSGPIRLYTSPKLGQLLLSQYIKDFVNLYPKVCIYHLDISESQSIEESGADLFIASETSVIESANLVRKELGVLPKRCYATQAYLDQHGEPRHPKELSQHHCIVYKEQRFWELNGIQYPLQVKISSNSPEAIVNYVELDMGISCLPTVIVESLNTSKKLVPILKKYCSNDLKISLYYLKKTYLPRRVRLLIDYILNSMARR